MSQARSDSQVAPVGLSSKQVFLVVAGSVALAVVAAMVLGKGPSSAGKSSGAEVEAANARIRPVAAVTVKLEGGPAKTGEEVYKAQCTACHAAGMLGAPKFGDAGAWGPRIGAGYAALLNSALKGKNQMAPQGGGDFSDYEIGRAVVYMANAGGAKLEEPKAPEAAK